MQGTIYLLARFKPEFARSRPTPHEPCYLSSRCASRTLGTCGDAWYVKPLMRLSTYDVRLLGIDIAHIAHYTICWPIDGTLGYMRNVNTQQSWA